MITKDQYNYWVQDFEQSMEKFKFESKIKKKNKNTSFYTLKRKNNAVQNLDFKEQRKK